MDTLKQAIDRLREVDVPALKREGRDFDFADVHQLLAEGIARLIELGDSPTFWDLYPVDQKEQAEARVSEFVDFAERIRDFDPRHPQQANPKGERDHLAARARQIYGDLYSQLFLPFRLHRLETQLQGGVGHLVSEAQEALTALRQQRGEADRILNAMRSAAAQSGLQAFAEVFMDEAARREASAKRWLGGAIVSALALGGLLWWSIDQFGQAVQQFTSPGDALQLLVGKLLVLSFALFVFYQVIKNYNANKHLGALNKHRANSLQTFQAFVQATEDPQVRDAVLIQAARAIFDSGPTGFVSSGAPPSPSVVETFPFLDRLRGE